MVGSGVFKRLLQQGDAVAQKIASKFDDIARMLDKAKSGGALSKTEQEAIRNHLDDLSKLADAENLDKTVANDLRAAIDEVEGALKTDSSIFNKKMNPDQAAENALTERDPQWPWRGLHATEEHHPLMKGKSFREMWKEHGFSNEEIERFKNTLDTDVHRALEESGYWQSELLFRIQQEEAELGGELLSKERLLKIVTELLDDIGRWAR